MIRHDCIFVLQFKLQFLKQIKSGIMPNIKLKKVMRILMSCDTKGTLKLAAIKETSAVGQFAVPAFSMPQ